MIDKKRWGVAALAALAATMLAPPARAGFFIHHPDAEPGEFEVEHEGVHGFDHDADKRNAQGYTVEFEYGVTDFWRTGIEGEWERESGPGNRTRFTALSSENTFQFTDRGEYWADAGFFAEYERGMQSGSTDEVTLGPLFRKQIGRTINVLNLLFVKEVGSHASGQTEFRYAWQTRLALGSMVEPGIEIYGRPGRIGHFASWDDQDNRAGPVLYGTFPRLGAGQLRTELGYLFGLSHAAPQGTLKWRLEYEVRF
jgi:hypothetical protein